MLGYPAKDMIVLGCSANQQIRNGGGGGKSRYRFIIRIQQKDKTANIAATCAW